MRAARAGRRSSAARRRRARAARRPARAAGTPSSARAPAVVRPSWTPALVPVVVDRGRARRAARRPSTSVRLAAAAVAPSRRRAARPPAARRSGSSTAARGARRAPEVDVVGHQRGDVRRQHAGTGAMARPYGARTSDVPPARASSELAVSSSSPSSSRVRSRSSPDRAARAAPARCRVRVSRRTGWPTCSSSRRTIRLRPSWITSSTIDFAGAVLRRSGVRETVTGPSSRVTPSSSGLQRWPW